MIKMKDNAPIHCNFFLLCNLNLNYSMFYTLKLLINYQNTVISINIVHGRNVVARVSSFNHVIILNVNKY